MPQAVAAAVATWATTTTAFTAAGVTVTATASATAYAAVYAAAYVTTTVVIGAGLSALGKAMAPKFQPGVLNAASPLQMGRDPVASRRVIFGETRVAGPLVYVQTTGANNQYLHVVEVLAGHECAAIGDIYFADEVVPLDGGGFATGTYTGVAFVAKHLGTAGQTADGSLVANSGGIWTNNHRLRGIANLYYQLNWNNTLFPGGLPNVSAVVKGALCYDPRTELTEWTDNVALCILFYLTNAQFGLGVDYATEIDEASFIAAANICDEEVELAAGGTEKRYRCNGSFELSAEPATVLEKLCETMAGFVVYVGGKWICQAGAHVTPTIELDENDLRGTISVQTRGSLRDTCNRVKGTYRSPAEKWQPADITPIVNSTYLSEDGGIEIWRDMSLDFVTSHSQGQRLLKIELERTRQDITVTMPCKLTALRVRAGSTVMVTNARFGWTQKLFIVTGFKFAAYESGGGPALGVDLELRETAEEVWDWNSGEETTEDPAPNTSLRHARDVAAPTSLVLTSGASTVLIQKDGTAAPRLKLAWTPPADQAVLAGGLVRIQYKTTAAPDWSEWGTVLGGQSFDFILDVLIGTAYDVRIRAENNFGAESAWITPAAGAHTVLGDQTGPNAPSGLSVTAFPGYNSVRWTGSTSDDISEYKIYRHTSNVPAAATYIGENDADFFDDDTATPGVAYYYFVEPIDGSENPGTRTLAGTVTTLDPPIGNPQPADPTAATKTGEGTYPAGDGTVFAWLEFSVPTLPAGAQWQEVVYRRNVSGEFMPASRQFKNTGGAATARIDDLSPGVVYQVGTVAKSAGKASNLVLATGSPFTAPNSTAVPTTPSGGAFSISGLPPLFIPSTVVRTFGSHVTWTDQRDSTFAYWEVLITTLSSTGSSVSAFWLPYDGGLKRTTPGLVIYDTAGTLSGAWVHVRQVSRSGVASAWHTIGQMNTVGNSTQAGGDMSEQDRNDVLTTGIKTGAGSVNKVLVRHGFLTTISLSGGSPTETYNFSLSGLGFSTPPDVGKITAANLSACEVRYDWDDSTSSTAVLRIRTLDGSNLPTSLIIDGEFLENF